MFQLFQSALQGRQNSKTGSQKTYVISLTQSQEDLIFIKEIIESGKVIPVIDGCYPLNKIAEAFWYFEKEHAKGKVVITIKQNGNP